MEPETGALSVEDAVSRLETEEAVEAQPTTPDQIEAEADAPEGVSEGEADETETGEPEADDQSEEEPEQPAIDPPGSWDADHKAKWESLPRDVQEYLIARETERDRGVSASQQKASEARQRADQEAQALAALKPQLDALLTQSRSNLDRWSGMDATAWRQLAQSDPNRYVALKADHEADVLQHQQLAAARDQAEAVEMKAFQEAQAARLTEIAPQMADPKVKGEVAEYLRTTIPDLQPEQLRGISADEALIAWKAMQYDRAQAPQPKPAMKKVVTAKPSTPPVPQKQRRLSDLETRFSKSASIDDAVALLNARDP